MIDTVDAIRRAIDNLKLDMWADINELTIHDKFHSLITYLTELEHDYADRAQMADNDRAMLFHLGGRAAIQEIVNKLQKAQDIEPLRQRFIKLNNKLRELMERKRGNHDY